MELYDVAVIGAGPGGYVAAIYASRLGKKVAVMEREYLGGTCLNRGCIPTKALLASAGLLDDLKGSSSFGIDITSFKVNFEKIFDRKEKIVKNLRQGIESLFMARGITLIKGDARLISRNTIFSAGRTIEAKSIIIATGSRPLEIPGLKFDHENILSSDDILGFKNVPPSLTIVGGGAIGCEFAAIYSSFGTKITLVEMKGELLPHVDTEIAKRLGLILKRKGVEVFTDSMVERVENKGGSVRAFLSSGKEVLSEKMLVCAGRVPNSQNLGIGELGIKMAGANIETDAHMRTNIPDIYAVGDVTGRFQLAHVASYEGMVACENISGLDKTADYRGVPNCIYTEPQIAFVGISEEEAKGSGADYKISRFPFSALGKAQAVSKTEGLVKLIAEKKTGRILGVHILGADATNVIAEAVLAIKKGLTAQELAETIHAHPTFPEGLAEACHIFNNKGIHTL